MKNVDWNKLAAIAEIFSAVAILITLIYLAVQTRYSAVQTQQNTAALLAANRQASLDAELQYLYEALDRPELEAVYGTPRLTIPGNEHDPDAFMQAQTMSVAFFRMRENLWLNYINGVLDQDVWEPYRGVMVNLLQNSDFFRASWDFYSPQFAPGFQQEINDSLSGSRSSND